MLLDTWGWSLMTEEQFDFISGTFVKSTEIFDKEARIAFINATKLTEALKGKIMNDHNRIHVLERKVEMLLQALATQTEIHAKLFARLSGVMGESLCKDLAEGAISLENLNDNLAKELERIDG